MVLARLDSRSRALETFPEQVDEPEPRGVHMVILFYVRHVKQLLAGAEGPPNKVGIFTASQIVALRPQFQGEPSDPIKNAAPQHQVTPSRYGAFKADRVRVFSLILAGNRKGIDAVRSGIVDPIGF